MIKSMTGYGRGQAAAEGLSFSVEIKTVNHRYGDVTVKSPRLLVAYENDIKKRVAAALKRGKIDIFISQDNGSQLVAKPSVDEKMVSAYLEVFENLKAISGLAGDLSLEFLASQRDVLVVKEAEFSAEDLVGCLMNALDRALEAVLEMRVKEGAATAQDIEARLDVLVELLGGVRERAPEVPKEWQLKLQERLNRLYDNGGDPQRIAQEVAIFADRCDISEELTRFDSHLKQFRELMLQEEPVGRQLDFLVQELNREANTMGSKSNDAALTRQVVTLKSELEKIREQVQNIE